MKNQEANNYKTPAFLEQLNEGYAGLRIAESKPVEIQRVENIIYLEKEEDEYVKKTGCVNLVVTGSIRDSFLDTLSLKAYRAVPLGSWSETKKPLVYAEHWSAVNRQNRLRSYDGMKMRGNLGGDIIWIVLKGPQISLLPMKDAQGQGELF